MGTYKEILEIEKSQGLDILEDIQLILVIISQEEQLDANAS